MQQDAPELRGPQDMNDGLARAEAALARAEAAAARVQARHQALRSAARDTLAGLDRLLANAADAPTDDRHG